MKITVLTDRQKLWQDLANITPKRFDTLARWRADRIDGVMKHAQSFPIYKAYAKPSDGEFHCTSEMAALFMIDYRRRLVDLKDKGYKFENRRCTKHSHPMKEWRLLEIPLEKAVEEAIIIPLIKSFTPAQTEAAKAFLTRWQKPIEKEIQQTLL